MLADKTSNPYADLADQTDDLRSHAMRVQRLAATLPDMDRAYRTVYWHKYQLLIDSIGQCGRAVRHLSVVYAGKERGKEARETMDTKISESGKTLYSANGGQTWYSDKEKAKHSHAKLIKAREIRGINKTRINK